MPLDSDMTNADSQLHVEFYEYKDAPYKGVTFVRIMVPGDKNLIIDQPMKELHKSRFPRQWLYYQMKNAGEEVPGVKLETWHEECPDELTMGQMEELQALKFRTVEQIASASDGQLQRVGMGGIGVRSRAKAYMARKNHVESSSELSDMKKQIAELQALLIANSVNAAVEKKKPGRPKKVPLNVVHNDAPTHAAGHE